MILPFDKHRLFKVKKWVGDGNSGQWEPGMEPDLMANVEETEDLNSADIVASETKPVKLLFSDEVLSGKHMVMFDVDVPVQLIQSSTPGHYHLYFPNTYVSKEHLFDLLDVLARVGIVEPGYVAASRARGFAALRLPWVRKVVPFKTSRPVF